MTNKYRKILLAVDFHEDCDTVVTSAQKLADLYGAELHAVHVAEPLGMAYAGEGLGWSDQVMALEAAIRKENRSKMNELAGRLGLSEDHCHLMDGRPATKIHELCSDLDIDLIVIGTHGQHGIQLLLGSTANSVLHGTSCDVHAVRLAA